MLVRRWALVAVVALGAGACAGNGDDTPDPTVPTDPPASVSASSTTATAPDVAAIPPVIDEAYLNAVLAALDRVDGDATRLIVAKKDLVPEAAERLAAVFDGAEFTDQTDVWLEELDTDPTLSGYRETPGVRRTVIRQVLKADPTCVWLAVQRDYSAVAKEPPTQPSTVYVTLQPLRRGNDPKGYNPTAWMIAAEGVGGDTQPTREPCTGR